MSQIANLIRHGVYARVMMLPLTGLKQTHVSSRHPCLCSRSCRARLQQHNKRRRKLGAVNKKSMRRKQRPAAAGTAAADGSAAGGAAVSSSVGGEPCTSSMGTAPEEEEQEDEEGVLLNPLPEYAAFDSGALPHFAPGDSSRRLGSSRRRGSNSSSRPQTPSSSAGDPSRSLSLNESCSQLGSGALNPGPLDTAATAAAAVAAVGFGGQGSPMRDDLCLGFIDDEEMLVEGASFSTWPWDNLCLDSPAASQGAEGGSFASRKGRPQQQQQQEQLLQGPQWEGGCGVAADGPAAGGSGDFKLPQLLGVCVPDPMSIDALMQEQVPSPVFEAAALPTLAKPAVLAAAMAGIPDAGGAFGAAGPCSKVKQKPGQHEQQVGLEEHVAGPPPVQLDIHDSARSYAAVLDNVDGKECKSADGPEAIIGSSYPGTAIASLDRSFLPGASEAADASAGASGTYSCPLSPPRAVTPPGAQLAAPVAPAAAAVAVASSAPHLQPSSSAPASASAAAAAASGSMGSIPRDKLSSVLAGKVTPDHVRAMMDAAALQLRDLPATAATQLQQLSLDGLLQLRQRLQGVIQEGQQAGQTEGPAVVRQRKVLEVTTLLIAAKKLNGLLREQVRMDHKHYLIFLQHLDC